MTARRITTLVYVGPTLPAAEVARLLPSATVMPPAAVGDVLRATRRRGVARIAIIDGYFERMAAVWHKEILVALGKGIEVWGAASMGALRAAELAPFGMRGVGHIYREYARGTLVADDEVAIAHMPAEYGYQATSDALVNIRFGLSRATTQRIIDEPTRARLLELARSRFYRERSWRQLLDDARAAGLAVEDLARWPKPDRKADDARLLLRALRVNRRVPPRKLAVPRTWALRQLERLL
jgi:hypothetical protein